MGDPGEPSTESAPADDAPTDDYLPIVTPEGDE